MVNLFFKRFTLDSTSFNSNHLFRLRALFPPTRQISSFPPTLKNFFSVRGFDHVFFLRNFSNNRKQGVSSFLWLFPANALICEKRSRYVFFRCAANAQTFKNLRKMSENPIIILNKINSFLTTNFLYLIFPILPFTDFFAFTFARKKKFPPTAP